MSLWIFPVSVHIHKMICRFQRMHWLSIFILFWIFIKPPNSKMVHIAYYFIGGASISLHWWGKKISFRIELFEQFLNFNYYSVRQYNNSKMTSIISFTILILMHGNESSAPRVWSMVACKIDTPVRYGKRAVCASPFRIAWLIISMTWTKWLVICLMVEHRLLYG